MTPRQFHSIACTETECDPPRSVEYEVRGRPVTVDLPGCPFWRPERTPGSVLGFDHTRSRDLRELAMEQWRRGLPPDDTSFVTDLQ